MKTLHLICNAHLDPAWLWELEEGAGEALSTFRIAANFCEEFDTFVFNHNEVILYKWIEEYDPDLFKRIQHLVEQGKWHIMGGWYLQPDCNMPSGEAFIRQILTGRRYFDEKFNKRPTTAINFDSFGHTRGLVQIMKKSGYDSYIFCRPDQNDCPLPSEDFTWVGYDGSEILGHRAYKAYLSGLGKANIKVRDWLAEHPERSEGLVLWGVGNHGGGPSRADLIKLEELKKEETNYAITHSLPESYFEDLRNNNVPLPKYEADLNPWAVGCYTSQILVKQKNRMLENDIFLVEKMMAHASLLGLCKYPKAEIDEAISDLMVIQFHDILAGTSIQKVEDNAIRQANHGLEILARLKARAFFALTSGQRQAEDGEVPIFIYNPHPFKIQSNFECEFQIPKGSKDKKEIPSIKVNGVGIPCQMEREESNLYVKGRKRVVFEAELEPGQINRFDFSYEDEITDSNDRAEVLEKQDGYISFKTKDLHVLINRNTGFFDRLEVDGENFIKKGAFKPIVIEDNDDSWGSQVKSFPNKIGEFELVTEKNDTDSLVGNQTLDSVRIIEDGRVRTVVEASFKYQGSYICQRYFLPKQGTEIKVTLTVYWNEKCKMLKLSVPTELPSAKYLGQVAYGNENLPIGDREVVTQKWSCAVSNDSNKALTCINNGIYGSNFSDGEIRLSLMRSPGYASLHGGGNEDVMPNDRFSKYSDQGQREFTFWFNAGKVEERLSLIDREALIHNEKPYHLTYFPSGEGKVHEPLIKLSDNVVQVATFKQSEKDQNEYIIRLFEPTGQKRTTTMAIPVLQIEEEIHLNIFEIKTFSVNISTREIKEVNIIEEGK
ncbi:glycoside hydrolase family 38 C-terminal domain-containing protein [Alteribacter aurantiacus]|uniref:glycoside hydrolase family 38 N-terminal domain-containing protein n=1 Tax=Alteribacter aurantiacus TaxID=254410 RepID=UPI00047B3FBB|nr:alpha-mannosidase [Alteribacter aurantiacus]